MDHLRPRAITGCCFLSLALLIAGCGSSGSSGGTPTSTPAATSSTANLGLISSNILTVGSDTSYPPQEYADPNDPSTYIGTDVDLANALAKAMGIQGATIVKGVFDTLITGLQAKRYDVVMSSMNDTPSRAKVVDFVDYMTASEAIMVKKGSPIRANDYSALCGKTVTVQRGTTELDGLNAANKSCSSKMTVLSFQDDTGAFTAFKAGRSDAYTSDLPVIANYVHMSPSDFQIAGTPISAGENYGVAVRKGSTALKAALQAALAKIRATGQYSAILKKWGVQGAALK